VRDFRIVCGKISLFDRSRDFSWRSKKSWPKRKNNYKKLKCRKETHEKEGIYSINTQISNNCLVLKNVLTQEKQKSMRLQNILDKRQLLPGSEGHGLH
jgi:hypothetical protein